MYFVFYKSLEFCVKLISHGLVDATLPDLSRTCSINVTIIQPPLIQHNNEVHFGDKNTQFDTEVENYIISKFGYWANTDHAPIGAPINNS